MSMFISISTNVIYCKYNLSIQTYIYSTHMCIHLYIILLSLLSHSTLVNTIDHYKGELPETFSIQVDLRMVGFMSLFTSFHTSLVEEGRKTIWHYIRC